MNDTQLSGNLVVLRRFTPNDARLIQLLAGDAAIAEMTLTIPHPYPDGAAEEWIAKEEARFAEGKSASFAITGRGETALVGCIGVNLDPPRSDGEIGYWIGRPFWGRGYCTGALQLFLPYCFSELGLPRVHARHFGRNPASGRVLQKAGLRLEKVYREKIPKFEQPEEVSLYSLLRSDFLRA